MNKRKKLYKSTKSVVKLYKRIIRDTINYSTHIMVSPPEREEGKCNNNFNIYIVFEIMHLQLG